VKDDRCDGGVAVGASCKIGVRFAPQAQGASSATLTISTNAPTQPAAIALSGTGGPLPQGPKGSTGASGKVELVTCQIVTKTTKVHGRTRKTTTKKCTTKLVSSPVKFTTAAADATLARGRIVYGTGTAVATGGVRKLSLTMRRHLIAGRYSLTLRYRSGHRTSKAVLTIT
jgi:hypothetical protein